jgi:hypothetical protein
MAPKEFEDKFSQRVLLLSSSSIDFQWAIIYKGMMEEI